MLEKYGFEVLDANECYQKYGWGIDLKEGTKVYRRVDGTVTTWVGCTDMEYEPWVCEMEIEGLVGQWVGKDPLDALINGYIDHLHKVAVMEEWTKPYLLGLKYCTEDVVNWLCYNVTNAITYGLSILVYNDGAGAKDGELVNHVMDNAIAMTKLNASNWGIEFVDVWED